jgi:hypothetical protein
MLQGRGRSAEQFIRCTIGIAAGCRFLIQRPNKPIERAIRDTDGDALFKILWPFEIRSFTSNPGQMASILARIFAMACMMLIYHSAPSLFLANEQCWQSFAIEYRTHGDYWIGEWLAWCSLYMSWWNVMSYMAIYAWHICSLYKFDIFDWFAVVMS